MGSWMVPRASVRDSTNGWARSGTGRSPSSPTERGHGHHRLRHRPSVDDRAACEGDRAPCGQDVLQDAIEDRHGVQHGPARPTLPRSIAGVVAVDAGASQLGSPCQWTRPSSSWTTANSSTVARGRPRGASSTCGWSLASYYARTPRSRCFGPRCLCRDRHGTGRFRHGSPAGSGPARLRTNADRHRRRADHDRGQRHAGRPEEEILRSMGGMETTTAGACSSPQRRAGATSRDRQLMVGSARTPRSS